MKTGDWVYLGLIFNLMVEDNGKDYSLYTRTKEQYEVTNQRQITASLETLKNQLNFAFQEELKQEVERFTWFNTRYGC